MNELFNRLGIAPPPERPELSAEGRIALREKAVRNGGADREAHGHKSDEWVANAVRMLMRTDLDHESICCAARDRIMRLSLLVDELTHQRDQTHEQLVHERAAHG